MRVPETVVVGVLVGRQIGRRQTLTTPVVVDATRLSTVRFDKLLVDGGQSEQDDHTLDWRRKTTALAEAAYVWTGLEIAR